MKLVGAAGRAIQLCQKPSCPGKDLASLSPMLKDLLPHCNVPMACHAAPPPDLLQFYEILCACLAGFASSMSISSIPRRRSEPVCARDELVVLPVLRPAIALPFEHPWDDLGRVRGPTVQVVGWSIRPGVWGDPTEMSHRVAPFPIQSDRLGCASTGRKTLDVWRTCERASWSPFLQAWPCTNAEGSHSSCKPGKSRSPSFRKRPPKWRTSSTDEQRCLPVPSKREPAFHASEPSVEQ